MTAEEYFQQRESIRRKVSAIVPESLRRVDPMAYRKALDAKSVVAAERIVQRYADKLSIPVVRGFRSNVSEQMKFLGTTGRYSQGSSDPRTFDHREPVPTGAVESLGPDTYKPKRKTRRRPKNTIGLPTREYVGLPFNARPTRDL